MVQPAVLGAGSGAIALRLAFAQTVHAVVRVGVDLVAIPPGLTLGDFLDFGDERSKCRQATDDDTEREFDGLPDHEVHYGPYITVLAVDPRVVHAKCTYK